MALTFPADLAAQIAPYLPPSPSSSSSSSSSSSPSHEDTRPFVTLTFASSLDAALSLSPGVQTHLSGPLSKAMTHHLRAHHSAILVGVSTAVADDPGLNCRLEGADLDRQPLPVILDPHARWQVSEDSRVIRTARDGKGRAPIIVTARNVVTENSDEDAILQRQRLLGRYGGGYVTVPASDGRFRWTDVLTALQRLGVRSVMVEGGGQVINSLLEGEERELVDAVIVTIAPTWLGQGGVVVSPQRTTAPFVPPRLRDVKWMPMGEDVVLCGRL
ncbi:2,5-diamino-6-(ribosylamino)-4(3H)-pyrimidinone 5'-phosphate reductase [Orbilia brochopaga]|uniref:2,5-diamino-6-ribosylamino-4(3H)-pyrimidinone 5'-phosphate reductase n=1 Tax=Orbilia brochopaga TaxID=3140254 RepID=A0AAV9VA13_9PEZI